MCLKVELEVLWDAACCTSVHLLYNISVHFGRNKSCCCQWGNTIYGSQGVHLLHTMVYKYFPACKNTPRLPLKCNHRLSVTCKMPINLCVEQTILMCFTQTSSPTANGGSNYIHNLQPTVILSCAYDILLLVQFQSFKQKRSFKVQN